MSETYVECLVKQRQSGAKKILKGLLIVVAVIMFLAMLLFPFAFIFALAAGAGAYAMHLLSELEYEYLYMERELVIDKIMAKSRRKRVGTFTLDRMEILAPIKSYHLDNYKNRTAKVKDYSIGVEEKPDKRYVMFYENGEKILLSPSEEMVKVMRNVSPRKIFMD